MAKEAKKPAEAVAEAEVKDSKADRKELVEAFIARKMKAINQMENEAKARNNAVRVLSNRKGY